MTDQVGAPPEPRPERAGRGDRASGELRRGGLGGRGGALPLPRVSGRKHANSVWGGPGQRATVRACTPVRSFQGTGFLLPGRGGFFTNLGALGEQRPGLRRVGHPGHGLSAVLEQMWGGPVLSGSPPLVGCTYWGEVLTVPTRCRPQQAGRWAKGDKQGCSPVVRPRSPLCTERGAPAPPAHTPTSSARSKTTGQGPGGGAGTLLHAAQERLLFPGRRPKCRKPAAQRRCRSPGAGGAGATAGAAGAQGSTPPPGLPAPCAPCTPSHAPWGQRGPTLLSAPAQETSHLVFLGCFPLPGLEGLSLICTVQGREGAGGRGWRTPLGCESDLGCTGR